MDRGPSAGRRAASRAFDRKISRPERDGREGSSTAGAAAMATAGCGARRDQAWQGRGGACGSGPWRAQRWWRRCCRWRHWGVRPRHSSRTARTSSSSVCCRTSTTSTPSRASPSPRTSRGRWPTTTLTGYSAEDFSPVPRLAESWESSEDGLTWTYNLVDNATFHDGEPLTADDVVYTFNRIIEGESIERTNYGSYVKNIETVEAVDDYTVEMTIKEPSPIMNNLAVPILPEHIWSEIDADELAQVHQRARLRPSGHGGLRAVHHDRRGQGPVLPVRDQSRTTGAARRTSTASSSRSTRTTTDWSPRCRTVRSTSPTTSRPTSSTRSRARTTSRRSPRSTPASTTSPSTVVRS